MSKHSQNRFVLALILWLKIAQNDLNYIGSYFHLSAPVFYIVEQVPHPISRKSNDIIFKKVYNYACSFK